MAELPFMPWTAELRDVIRHDYISPAVSWLMGKSTTGVLAQESNSNWEAALTIRFFSEAREMFLEHQEESSLCATIPTRCCVVARWLLDNLTEVSAGMVCWDGGTWDTSVVVRALITCLTLYREGFSDSEAAKIVESTVKALRWLELRFSQWEREVKYPFGPADVAQILITAVFVREMIPNISGAELEASDLPVGPDVMKDIVNYLLHIRTQENPPGVQLEDESFDFVWWGDFFQTAEVLEALAEYYRYHKRDARADHKTLEMIEDTAVRVFRFLEYSQEESMWGTHVDTLRTVYSYIRVPTMLPIVSPEPHILFKALRWICDEKQRFPDGSFLHTMFLTIFMVDALVQVHNYWELAQRTIGEVYDDCLWAAPVRTSSERTARFAAELDGLALKRALAESREQLSNLTEQQKRIGYSLGLTIVALSLLGASGSLLNLARVTFNFSIVHTGDWLKLLALLVSTYIAVLVLIWRR